MPYIHKIHIADIRVVTSSQDYTPAICRRVEAFQKTTEDIPKTTCQNCAGKFLAWIRWLDAGGKPGAWPGHWRANTR